MADTAGGAGFRSIIWSRSLSASSESVWTGAGLGAGVGATVAAMAPLGGSGAGFGAAPGAEVLGRGGPRLGGLFSYRIAENPRSMGMRKKARAIRPPTGGETFASAAATNVKRPSMMNSVTATARAAVDRCFTRAARPA